MTTGRINQVASVTDPARLAAGTTHKGERAGQQRRRASYRATESYEGQTGNRGPVSAACTAPARTEHARGPMVEEASYRPPRTASASSNSPGNPTRGLRGGEARARQGYRLKGMEHKNRRRYTRAQTLDPAREEGSVEPFLALGREPANNHDPHATHPPTRSAKTATPDEPRPARQGGCEQAEASEGAESTPRGRFSNTNKDDHRRAKARPRERPVSAHKVISLLPSAGRARGTSRVRHLYATPRSDQDWPSVGPCAGCCPTRGRTRHRPRETVPRPLRARAGTSLALGRARSVAAPRGCAQATRRAHVVLRDRPRT